MPAAPKPGSLEHYRARRNFTVTPEPADTAAAADAADRAGAEQLAYVIQKHDATRLHYDFRLELDGVLLSWAVPKGPSLDPAARRMAVRTEDHPLAYAGFEGTIPPKQYGAGTVIVWDRGWWTPVGDPRRGLAAGKLAFELHGRKLQGRWELVRMARKPGERQEAWLLFKKRDAHARTQADYDVVTALPDSVLRHPLPPPPAPPAQAPAATTPAGPPPETLSPQLATLASAVPDQGRWIYETKFDGYRLLVRIEGGVPRLITRGGHDWTDKMPVLAKSLAALGAGDAWLDGEIVVGGADGSGDFNALQNAFDRARGARKSSTQTIAYRVFDLPWFEGHDLRGQPLYARRELLQQWLRARPQPHVTMSEALGDGDAALSVRLLRQACKAGLEGLIAKRADAPYRSTRSTDWLKLKCHQRQEFVVGGYVERSDDARAVGSLILGVHDGSGRLRHAGSVGTGWDHQGARDLLARLVRLRTARSPFEAGEQAAGRWGRRGVGLERWVRPTTVVEVSYAQWTPAGHIRHAVYMGLRSDKPARAIGREQPASPETLTSARAAKTAPAQRATTRKAASAVTPAGLLAGIKVTHGERVVDAASGHTKLDLVRYYDSMADFILPHLKGRPVALVRGPGGVGAPLFFQKHGEKIGIPGIRELDPALWPGHAALLEVATRQALLGAAQMNVIEFHTWNAQAKNLAKPDRMIFDLDPGDGVAWPAIREGALLVRALLQELGLRSWLKTSGGKGLHVVVPLAARLDFDTVKACSKAVVEHLSRTIPERFVARSGPANRKGRIFVDYLRNGEGATTVAAYSARARPGLGVSMPVAWDELQDLKSAAQWTVSDARDRLSLQSADPWADMAGTRQSLGAAMKALGFDKAAL